MLRCKFYLMEIRDVNLKRFIASEGKALKWSENYWNEQENVWEILVRYSSREEVIDLNSIVGEVKEIPYDVYKEETKRFCYCLGRI